VTLTFRSRVLADPGVTLKARIRHESIEQCKQRAMGPKAKLNRDALEQMEKTIKRKWLPRSGDDYEVTEQIKSAIAEKIVDAERPHMTHWLLPPDERIHYIDTEKSTVKESFLELQRIFAESQFKVQQHISQLDLRLDPFDEVSRKMLTLADCEEQSRQEAIKIASLLAQGKQASEMQSFTEAVKYHQEAYDLALAGQKNEEARLRANAVCENSSLEGLQPVTTRWQPQFPDTMPVENPEGTLLASDWVVPISPDQIARALAYSEEAMSDYIALIDARIEVEDMLATGALASETWDLDTAIQKFARGMTFDLTSRRFTHAHVDEPLMERLRVALEEAHVARDVRDAVRDECWACQKLGEAALAGVAECLLTDDLSALIEHVKMSLQHYGKAVELVPDAHDRDLMEQVQLGQERAETAKGQAEDNKLAMEKLEKSAAAMKKRYWTAAFEHATKAADLAHSKGVKASTQAISHCCDVTSRDC